MRNNKALYFLFAFLIICSFASAATLSTYPSKAVGEEFSFCQTCQDSTYITLSSIETPNSTEFINVNMTNVGGGSFCYNYTPSKVGRYDFRGISDGCERTFATYVDITISGEKRDASVIVAYIFLILSISAIIYILHKNYKGHNRKEATTKITEAHDGNWSRTFIKSLGSNLMRNSFLWYYSLGWLILIVFKELVQTFNSYEIYTFFVLLLNIYSIGFFFVIIVWIGILINHFRIITDIINDLDLGVDR